MAAVLEIKFSATPVFACFSKLDFRPSTLLLNVILLPTPKRFLKSLWLTNTYWSWWSRVSFIWIFFLLKMLICFFNKLFGPVFGVFWSNSSISLGPLADFYSYTKHIKKEFDPKWWWVHPAAMIALYILLL